MANGNSIKQQRDLRKSIAERVRTSPSHAVDRVARDFDVSPPLIYRACAEHGVSLVRSTARVDDPIEILGRLLQTEEAISVTEAARKLGVPRQRVDDVLDRARRHRIPLGHWDGGPRDRDGGASGPTQHGRADTA